MPHLTRYHVTHDAICSAVTLWPRLDVEKGKLRLRESECLSHTPRSGPRAMQSFLTPGDCEPCFGKGHREILRPGLSHLSACDLTVWPDPVFDPVAHLAGMMQAHSEGEGRPGVGTNQPWFHDVPPHISRSLGGVRFSTTHPSGNKYLCFVKPFSEQSMCRAA